MRIVVFTHSVISDWNHGNAHFLRGVATELLARGHSVQLLEPRDGWSRTHLLEEAGEEAVHDFERAYPKLKSRLYDLDTLDIDAELDGADLALVHEWNPHELVRRCGEARAKSSRLTLLFHDTHHRSLTDRENIQRYDLRHYDGVLAFGGVIRDTYRNWSMRAWTWHEAADTRVFLPGAGEPEGDVVWIGNWGDDERSDEIREFLIEPVRRLGLKARVYGVRYPAHALAEFARAGIQYGGWLPNYRVPEIFARYQVTVHIPRRPYASVLPGIPTIRVFEALACGIPLVSGPWSDSENLFTPGRDYLLARDGAEMERHLKFLLSDRENGRRLAAHGLQTIRARHTCAHRVDELLAIHESLTSCRLPSLVQV